MKLIFIHGSGGCGESWRFQVEHFDGSEAVNLPGHPDGELCPTIEEYVQWLRGYIQERDYRDVVLVGHSLGGGIALQYALSHADDLKGVVLVGSGARLRVHPSFLEALEKALGDPKLLESTFATSYDLIEPELAEVIKRRAAENGPASFLNDLKACDSFDVMDRIDSLKIPILALCGEQDVMTPPKYTRFLADRLPNVKAVVIPGGTHFVYAEKPEETNRAIEGFLNSI
ncbi:MAG: alpha/beta hydrolase [Proteobacteria bacterium]|nr:alpha/beta hydrolase [Pseudomonadota bacterium]